MAAAPPSHSRIADAARSAAAGSVAGASVSAVLQPFDTLRTRLQADATTGTARPVGATLRAIAAEGHGVSSLWRGSTATVLRVGGGAGLHFFSLQLLRGAAAGGSGQRPQWVGDAAMGGTARAVAASGAAASRFSYASVPEALASISRREGACFRPSATQPFDVLRTRGSLEAGYVFIVSQPALEKTRLPAALRLRAMLDLPGGGAGTQGMQLRALLAGIGPRLVKRSLQTALLWTMYEEVADLITAAGASAPADAVFGGRFATGETPRSTTSASEADEGDGAGGDGGTGFDLFGPIVGAALSRRPAASAEGWAAEVARAEELYEELRERAPQHCRRGGKWAREKFVTAVQGEFPRARGAGVPKGTILCLGRVLDAHDEQDDAEGGRRDCEEDPLGFDTNPMLLRAMCMAFE
ncbi:hypothetical protein EMIHUDRAFT_104863 [Emiliania huxleyi CCMP1516]|uniref:Uncharacterized protein n=2 Tax=Emiliania huxleyi TaxID=2903 RepID=A0A0D3IIK2_EMIH1|nr:hypothetical protein EMIHUDRAFT_104863 [Emiliania huxleyi CCMP1516]EOD11087.1 hypothetical protein EMIHUDRAFT_104863 [Emiliania huxleyi CCMP1516]|eukprot:XP_005763516.1 hypothetical protein EMIHUDRAFT_104863 [Emiliania huxleyi CCMP1516]